MVVNKNLIGCSTVKVLLSVIFFVSVLSIIAYACHVNFCSSIACDDNSDCYDTCDGNYWFYGYDVCSCNCYFNESKHCKFQYKVCADADTEDGFPETGGSVRACSAACDQDSDYSLVESMCYFGCDAENTCEYIDNCSVESYCVESIRYYNGSCSGEGCSFESEDCSELTTDPVCSGVGTDTIEESVGHYGCLCGECKVMGGGAVSWTCDSESECTSQSCGEADRYCYYDSGYVWNNSYPEIEIECCDGYDNDCDDLIDELDPDCFECEPGEQTDCDLQLGVCEGSQATCTEQGEWLCCDIEEYNFTGDYEVEEVRCDGLDNDCDGEVDEGCECVIDEDCDDSNYCTNNECLDGSCVYTNVEDGTECDDDNPETVNDVCTSGVCAGQPDEDGDGYGSDVDCDDSNPNVNPGATEVCDDGIDNNCNDQIDCDDSSCSEHLSCVPTQPPIPTGGGLVIGGGPILGDQKVIIPPVCGNDICEYNETCSNCPEDCLKEGEICCNDIAYSGNCCVDFDCGEGYECDISKNCQVVYVKEEEKPEICEEDWECIKWSECVNGTQTRNCVDKNDCGTIEKRPDLVQSCEEPSPATGLFLFLTSPIGYGSILTILIIFLVLFLWRRRKL